MMVKLFAQGGELAKADSCSTILLHSCQQSDDRQTEAKCWMWRGLYTVFSPKTTAARIAWLERAIALYKKDGNNLGIINALTDKAYLDYASLQPDLAIRGLQTALDLEDSIHFPFTHYTAEDLADLGGPGHYNESLHYALSAVRTAQAAGDSIGWASFYQQLGFLYSYDGFDSAAIAWDRQAMRRHLLTGEYTELYRLMENIAFSESPGNTHEVLEELKKIHALYPPVLPIDKREYHMASLFCYQYLKDYINGEKEVREVLRWQDSAELLRGPFDRAHLFVILGSFYYNAGNWKKARYYFESSLRDASHKTMSIPPRLETQIFLFKLDSADGRFVDAIRHFEEASLIEHDNYTRQVDRDQSELKIQYQTGRKDQEIINRDRQIGDLEQRDKLRQANLRQANLIRNITIAAIAVLLVVGVLFFRQYRQRQQTAALILQKNELLQHLVSEKEWLLKEVHHRVKNNLHTIICLLESQANYLENDALRAIEVSQHRIYAMSLLHQKIYQSADVRTIDMASYIPEFIGYLWESFGSPSRIQFDLSVNPLKLDIAQTIPIALIINEGVTNSIKHAFPGNSRGTISVSLNRDGESIILVVADNGIGMGPMDIETEPDSLGLELVKGLTREMGGEVIFDTRAGTSITVTIQADTSMEDGFELFKGKKIVAT
jgi:two-component sensor histidine kinase